MSNPFDKKFDLNNIIESEFGKFQKNIEKEIVKQCDNSMDSYVKMLAYSIVLMRSCVILSHSQEILYRTISDNYKDIEMIGVRETIENIHESERQMMGTICDARDKFIEIIRERATR